MKLAMLNDRLTLALPKISGDLIVSPGIPFSILYLESAILLEIKSERMPSHG